MQANNADFSFAGIKTAVRRAIEAEAPGPATEANLQVPCRRCRSTATPHATTVGPASTQWTRVQDFP